ncbi:co-chaperone [Cryptococcus gattii Ru294]|uniref:Tubulin-specific chaperone A n=4 Tax=Cryptococcus gattii species complex TaxID=1884637 RepID=E6R406_CRYGW|nr:Co-chaperone, putative [Cryptococcus gattii WM276]KIR49927.1 co-chaperone [Cryptococcus bacillisporus CA1280]KIR57262.1 co-chaperone [Cryptococcus gattii Ru294]KIR68480.1 co-chaperone [Cryptococcus bacillisporus CA1873]KIR80727.1 co-chaperone [Cryptococcus gattii EJB2]KIY35585.1 co-chaperone [Cryptococcus gattii E566]KJE04433.1 co-chaperone [Cryptococcus gattii NT-10]|eukprot:KIR68480.1 co-chaperone [Cryptococcus gattii CA1873]
MPDETSQTLRQLKIKTGVVKRLHKEESSYIQEVEDQQKVVEKLKADGADGADIRAAERVLKDSEMMVPRTRRSLEEAFQALEDLNAVGTEESVASTQEFREAFSQLQQVEVDWKTDGN